MEGDSDNCQVLRSRIVFIPEGRSKGFNPGNHPNHTIMLTLNQKRAPEGLRGSARRFNAGFPTTWDLP